MCPYRWMRGPAELWWTGQKATLHRTATLTAKTATMTAMLPAPALAKSGT